MRNTAFVGGSGTGVGGMKFPMSARERDDLMELSDVSFLSRERYEDDGKDMSDESDQDFEASGRHRQRLFSCLLMSACAVVCISFIALAKSSMDGLLARPGPPWTSVSAWGPATEVFASLGEGLCLDVHRRLVPVSFNTTEFEDLRGVFFQPAHVASDGSSSDCQARCAALKDCTGYVTFHADTADQRQSGCSLIQEDDGYPAAGDGNSSYHCFWRHHFPHNSAGIYDPPRQRVSSIIWTYWQDMHQEETNKTVRLRAFLDLCHQSWRQLNPGWYVRILNQDTIWQYLLKEEMPEGFDDLSIQHKSDAIRLALLVKYGGVWLDASTLLLQPLSNVVNMVDPSQRIFYANENLINREVFAENRYGSEFHIENWFFAAPPQDPFLARTMSCVKFGHSITDKFRLGERPDIFTARQLEDLHALGIGNYLLTDACMFKTIDEDKALYDWWKSPSVHRINWLGAADPFGGEAIFKWQSAERKYPLHAGGFNHRAEALYRAFEESPQNMNVKDAVSRGLRKVKILHWSTPDTVFAKMVSLLNQFHQGYGLNHWDDLPQSQFACVESQFAYPGDTKKENLPESQFACVERQFAYPGATEGGPAGEPVHLRGEPVRLSWGQRKRNCWRAGSLILGPKKEDLPESQFTCAESQFASKKEDLPESQFASPGAKEGGPAGEPVRLCGEPVRLSW
eukprot:s3875_g1.t1